jgi:phosphoserine/homoserine phosphotransferase
VRAVAEPLVACLDLEGVLVPEIWINVAAKTGIVELRRTTRDEPDYDRLMRDRLAILERERLTLADIQAVIATIRPLDGAPELLDWLRARMQVIILSDTFSEFAQPLMAQLGYPCLFCNSLTVDAAGHIRNYTLRIADGKRKAVMALKLLNFRVVAAGDSYNDTTMLDEADAGILFRPPDNVIRDFPQFPVTHTYDELRAAFERATSAAVQA